MISHLHKYVFIHIPKNAGSSVEIALVGHEVPGFDGRRKFLTQEQRDHFHMWGGNRQHHTAQQIEKNKIRTLDYKRFAIVSNPFRRIISEFFYMRDTQPMLKQKYRCFLEGDVNAAIQEGLIWKHCWPYHGMAQVGFVQTARTPVKIYKLEALSSEWGNVLEFLNLPPGIQLPLANRRSPACDFREVLDDHSMEIVRERYRKDFETFGYDAEGNSRKTCAVDPQEAEENSLTSR